MRIVEAKFDGNNINWTWEPLHGTVEGIIEYLQSCEGAVLYWYDFRKHPSIKNDNHVGFHCYKRELRTDRRVY